MMNISGWSMFGLCQKVTIVVTEETYHGQLTMQADNQVHQFQLPLSALLPMFYEKAKSVAIIQHSMDMLQQATHALNPGQIPVIAFDQPLYALAKQIQWDKEDVYGEKNCVIMLGGLHILMAALKVLGDWLEGSGWTEVITKANISTSGVADSMLEASQVTRTRHAHQFTCCALYSLLHKVNDFTEDTSKTVIVTKDTKALCNYNGEVSPLTNCNHEEADTRIMLHSLHAPQNMALVKY